MKQEVGNSYFLLFALGYDRSIFEALHPHGQLCFFITNLKRGHAGRRKVPTLLPTTSHRPLITGCSLSFFVRHSLRSAL